MNMSPMDTSGPQSVSRLCSKAKKPLLNARMLGEGEGERDTSIRDTGIYKIIRDDVSYVVLCNAGHLALVE